MKCPFCGQPETKVIDSRTNQSGDAIRRRRECEKCQARFTTHEKVEVVMPMIIKKDGRREPFAAEKIMGGLIKACQKRPITTEQMEKVVTDIEQKLQAMNAKEVPAHAVGQLIMQALKDLDKVAYIRFASVYRDFRDVDEFVSELKELTSDGDAHTAAINQQKLNLG